MARALRLLLALGERPQSREAGGGALQWAGQARAEWSAHPKLSWELRRGDGAAGGFAAGPRSPEGGSSCGGGVWRTRRGAGRASCFLLPPRIFRSPHPGKARKEDGERWGVGGNRSSAARKSATFSSPSSEGELGAPVLAFSASRTRLVSLGRGCGLDRRATGG